jgi:hypothetical protein
MATEYSPIPGVLEDEDRVMAAYARIEGRRELVWEMMIQGTSELRMAVELKVNRKTVHKDVVFWRDRLSKHVAGLKTSKSRVTEEIGNTIKRLEWIFQNAAMEYTATTVALSKNRFLGTCLKAETAKIKILQETGFLPKAGIKLTVEQTQNVNFATVFGKEASALDDPVKRRKAIEVAARIIAIAPSRVKGEE